MNKRIAFSYLILHNVPAKPYFWFRHSIYTQALVFVRTTRMSHFLYMNFQRVELKNPHECKIHKNHRKNFFDLSFSQKFYIFHLDEFGMDCQILLEIFVQILKPSLEERVLNRSYRLLQTRCVLLQRMCREHHGYRTIEYRVAQNWLICFKVNGIFFSI